VGVKDKKEGRLQLKVFQVHRFLEYLISFLDATSPYCDNEQNRLEATVIRTP
jgi:hypothetical protein